MQFTLPTTESEMYATLREIFHYYRISRQQLEEPTITPLALTRLSYTKPSGNDIWTMSRNEITPVISAERYEKAQKIDAESAKVTYALAHLDEETQEYVAKVNAEYDAAENKVTREAEKKGLAQSNIILDKLAEMETARANAILKITTAQTEKRTSLLAQQTQLNTERSSLETYFSTRTDSLMMAKRQELHDKYDKIVRDVFRYNNSLNEKEQRYAQSAAMQNAELTIKRAQLAQNFFTKDELVEMGYYDDVISCVCGYYDTLDAVTAARNVAANTHLPVYLDDYYQNIVAMYTQRMLQAQASQ